MSSKGFCFWTLVACDALLVAGHALSFPFMAVYLTVHRGVAAGWVGLFLSASMLAAALAQGIGGEWSDLVGRRKVMLASLWTRAATVALMSWAMWTGRHYAWLVGLHMLGMFLGSFFGPAAKSWVADTVEPENRVRAYGFLRMGANLGWAVGPALGGALALKSYPMMFLLTAVTYVASALIVWLGVQDSPISRHRESTDLLAMFSALRDGVFARLCVYSLLISAVMSQLVVSLSLHCVQYLGMAESRVGLLFSLNGAVVVLLQYGAARILEKSRLTAGLAAGCLFYGAGYLGVGFAHGFRSAAVAIFVLTLGEILVAPGMQTLAANIAPERYKGRYLGLQGILQQTGSSLGIMLGGIGNQHLSPLWPPAPWCAVAGLAVAAAMGFFSLRRHVDPAADGLVADAPLEAVPAVSV
ncbi:MAG: MFS transporter [Elusimicrobia bacterium]|nr:MFS transporter [Elusimicrobiota bacterium]